MKHPAARIWAWLIAGAVLSAGGCSSVPRLVEHDAWANAEARLAPVVVMGVAHSDVPVGPPVPSRRDPDYPMQLHRVRVRIENVLKGSVSDREIAVYYFAFAEAVTGPMPLGFGREPSRRILWLHRDHGVFRTACDGWDNCTSRVRGGGSPDRGRARRPALLL